MDTCWRCGQKLPQKVKFCPSCGATIAAPPDPVPAPVIQEREPFDPLAATAPASAEQLAALRRGEVAPPPNQSRYRGGTKPMKSQPEPPKPAQSATPPPSTSSQRGHQGPANARGVSPTVNDAPPSRPKQGDLPTLRSGEAPPVTPSVISPRAVSHLAAPQTPARPSLAAGARVLVEWSDGRRYPATVQQLAAGQCLVLFPDGQQRWVDVRHVSLAMP